MPWVWCDDGTPALPVQRYRARPGVALIRIADPEGKLRDFYPDLNADGVLLPEWVAHYPEQIKHFLELGFVERCDPSGTPTDPGRVLECLAALDAAELPIKTGRPRAAQALSAKGHRFSNATLSEAIRRRKAAASTSMAPRLALPAPAKEGT